ncbi:MAG: T9SS type A sorting domain-containing protein [Bacteroidota bacterium]|nr:T9SS type A sorting domain-containing protein [Bacteroidota bacterium]
MPTGIKPNKSSEFLLYPNPASDKVHIQQNTSSQKINEVVLINTYGSEYKLNLNDKNEVDVSQLAEGVYIVKIKTNAGIITKKIVIHH